MNESELIQAARAATRQPLNSSSGCMRRKYTTFACVCAAAARTRRRPRRIPSSPSGADWRASARMRRCPPGSTVWRATPALTCCGAASARWTAYRSTTRTYTSRCATVRPRRRSHVEGRETPAAGARGACRAAGGLPARARAARAAPAQLCGDLRGHGAGARHGKEAGINRARLLLRNYLAAGGNFFEKPASKVTECNQTVGGERNAI